jgi:hypothetical protein
MKYLIIKMPDGAQFKVPRHIVAEARAFHYEVEIDGKSPTSPEVQAAIESYEDHDLFDWANNNMNWEDLEPYAKLHRPPNPPTPYATQFLEGCEFAVVELEEEV